MIFDLTMVVTEKNDMELYESKIKQWDKYATIRSRPRRIFPETTDLSHIFPHSKQPIAIHPLIIKRGGDIANKLLIQSVYKFMYDIAILETEMVNKGALMIANNQLSVCNFPRSLQHDALSIIIDEAYHAYVAIDFINQIEKISGVQPLNFSTDTTVKRAIKAVKGCLDPKYHQAFELVAVCIGEHVLTKELVSLGKTDQASEEFKLIMQDHVADEGRHANMFAYVLEFFWSQLPADYQSNIGTNLPLFLHEYLDKTLEIEFDKKVLEWLNFSASEINQIIEETHVIACNRFGQNNPVVINLITLLQRTHVLDHSLTAESFEDHKISIV